MDLIAISYYNIGPFKDKNLNIFFDKGKFLIQAPIGSGKSFLFFDGPIYALYKNTGRNVLNVDSKTGYIKLFFEVEGQKYLVVRNLAQGKSKDVCKSQLFTVEGTINSEEGRINDIDIEDLLKKNGANLEEIIFKNERDLDGNLSEFLPPREVFLSTVFLLQDSENVFELQPADRLTVMKNIFNLIGIDEIKEQIANKRRDIQTTIKVKSDTSNWDFKIKSLVNAYVNNFRVIERTDFSQVRTIRNDNYIEFITELETVADKVNINEFSVEGFDKNLNINIDKYISEKKGEHREIFVKKQHAENQAKEKNQSRNNNLELKTQLESKIKNIEYEINKIDPEKIEEKKKEKMDLIGKSDEIGRGLNLNITIPENLKKYLETGIESLEDLNNIVNMSIAKGQNFADQKINIELRIANQKLKKESESKNKEMELKNINENKKNLEEQLKNIVGKIQNLNKTINEESEFSCIKIGSNCPFIKDINKKTFEELEKQMKNFEEEKIVIESKIQKEGEKIKSIDIDCSLISGGIITDDIKKTESELKNTEKNILDLRDFLTNIDYKNIQNKYKERKEIQNMLQGLDKEIISLELGAKEIENYKNEKIKLGEQMINIDKNIENIQKDLLEINKLLLDNKHLLEKFDIEKLDKLEKINRDMMENIRDIENIINEFKESQLSLNKLKQEEKIVKDLYQIFSKELLLFVLEGYLPILTDIINSFLAQVVDYTIDIKLLQRNDNLEMDVKVYDEKGERDIKSLSGGQKVILKLVWMLAISSYMKSTMLFLDETINNLDNDTVGKVADMLSDFVKQREIKLYTVTHSQQIQEMDIWDKIIHIEDIV